jgi:putative phage-type endonuclease
MFGKAVFKLFFNKGFLKMNQGSNAWLDWRMQGIGSSDAPSIMGVGYKTRNQLYLEKVFGAVEKSGNEWIFEKGHRIESQARSLLEIIHGGVEFRAGLCQMRDYPFLRASMDGANFEISRGKEFKLVSKKEFDEGVCPERYYPQIQHQYMVTDLEEIDIVLCCEVGKLKQLKIKEVKVPKNLDYILNKLLPAELDFWFNHVLAKIPPKMEKGDAIKIKDKALIEKIKKLEKMKLKLRKMSESLMAFDMETQFLERDIKAEIVNMNDHELLIYKKNLYRKIQTVRIEECI